MLQANLAPDLIDLLGHHQQQVDPNLLILSNALQTAENVLNGDAIEDDTEEDPTIANSLDGMNESS